MNIVITGANGSLGYEVVKQLDSNNNNLFLFDRTLNKYTSGNNYILLEADIVNLDKLNSLSDNINCIIHLAAKVHVKPKNDKERDEFYQINYEATKNLYHWRLEKRVKHFIFISTLSVYGETTFVEVNEESKCNPSTDYAKSKYQAEEFGLKLFENNNFPITIFRLATLYGKYDRGNYGKLIGAVQKGYVPMIGKGVNNKPIVYVKDAASVIVRSLFNKEMIGQKYIISEGNYSFKDIVLTLKKLFNPKLFIVVIPMFVINIFKVLRLNFSVFGKLITLKNDFKVNNSKLTNTLKYSYKYNFESGLKDSFDYYNSKKEK